MTVDFALTLLGVAAGLTLGGLAGYRIGERTRGRRGVYWSLNVAVVLGCAVIDFVGLVTGQYWLAYGAIGLMAGLITGMKYGHVDAMRVWHHHRGAAPVPAEPPSSVADAPKPVLAPSAEKPAGPER